MIQKSVSPLDLKPVTMAAIQSQSEVAVKPTRSYGAIAMWAAVWFAVVGSMAVSLCAQESAPMHTGVPQDWSQHHIVFSRDGLAQHPDLIYREPRVLQRAMQRGPAPNFGVLDGSGPVPAPADNSGPHGDWSFPSGGRMLANEYPAKFSFNPGAPPDCTNDYVVFGLNITSTGTAANLVAFNNLYAGTSPTGLCGTVPTVLFAYDVTTVTGGKVATSPVLSQDGKKIAFVESIPANAGLGVAAQSILHVLTWANVGSIGGAVVPANWVSITLPSAKNDMTSSPWIDYYSDTAFVGSATGWVYKITGVFRGTPTLVTPPWTNPIVANQALTSPVLDSRLGKLIVGSTTNGILYQIDTTSGVVVAHTVGQGANKGILAAPIVDVTNGVTFVVSSNCGTVCAPGVPSGAVLFEADTATMNGLSEASIGLGAFGGTVVNLYQPALDNNYYNNPSTGLIHLCGTGPADTTPYHYAFGFTQPAAQPILKTTASVAAQLPTVPASSANARCTGWTEFFNPNIGTGGTDFFFFGLSQDCTAAGTTGGCVEELAINGGTTTPTKRVINGGSTGVVIDNYASSILYPQASSIYFGARLGPGTAYKMTQNGLN